MKNFAELRWAELDRIKILLSWAEPDLKNPELVSSASLPFWADIFDVFFVYLFVSKNKKRIAWHRIFDV